VEGRAAGLDGDGVEHDMVGVVEPEILKESVSHGSSSSRFR